MNEQLKRTPLADEHIRLGARMVEFGGWYMPVQYSGLVDEHHLVRRTVGLFDVCHMGEVRVEGREAMAFLSYLLVNDVTRLADGEAHYSVMATPEGTVIDDLLVYRFGDDHFLLVVNASTQDKDFAWIRKHAGRFDVTVVRESDETGQIAIQGPLAPRVLQKITDFDLAQIRYYHFREMEIRGIPALVSRTGYTGEDGFECYIPARDTVRLWRLLMEAGEAEGIGPAGLGARDTLRLEARMHLYGNDMDETTTTLEAGLGWVTKLKKESDFIGKAALVAQKKAGLTRRLVGFVMEDRGIARHGYPILENGAEIGRVTSGSHSPTLKKSIGLAYVPVAHATAGSRLHIKIRNKSAAARVVKGAFYKRA